MPSSDPGVTLYLRLRGKVSGPFTRTELNRLREQGRLTAFHEVSIDGQRWQLASEAGLVPLPGGPRPEPELTLELGPRLTPASEPTKRWFYLDASGAQQGPLSPEQVASLARDRVIAGHTLVWCEGQAGWLPAAATELASLLPAGTTVAAQGRLRLNIAALIAGLVLMMLGAGCFGLAWIEEARLRGLEQMHTQPIGPSVRPGAAERPEPRESRVVVYLLLAAGVFLGGTGVGVIVLGALRRAPA